MKVTLFFRKPSARYHSIEKLFGVIQKKLPEWVEVHTNNAPCMSTGIWPRLKILWHARQNISEVNHITGDIHFIAFVLPKSRTILTIHDTEVLERTHGFKHWLLKTLWFSLPVKRVSAITFISEFSKNEMLKYIKIPEHKIYVIPNCVSDIYQFHPNNGIVNRPVLFQIGTKANKNLENLVKAITNFDCKLLIAGTLSERQTELLIEANVDYESFGNITAYDIRDLYQRSDMLVFASTYEGFGLPILEAQAIGRPVITSNCASMPYVAGDAALLVDPHNPVEIRNAIERLVSDPELRNSLIKKGLENVKRFKIEAVADEYAQVYAKIGQVSSKVL